tara:strand:- start:11974 stop:13875 length:1902 start_codon:yes stop_codon:yes gene_type:complete
MGCGVYPQVPLPKEETSEPEITENALKMLVVTSNPFNTASGIDPTIHDAYNDCFNAITQESDVNIAIYMWHLDDAPKVKNTPVALIESLVNNVQAKNANAEVAFDIDYIDKKIISDLSAKFDAGGIQSFYPKFKAPGKKVKANPKFHDKTFLFSKLKFNNSDVLKELNGKELNYVVIQSSANIVKTQYSQANQMIIYYGDKSFYDYNLKKFNRLKKDIAKTKSKIKNESFPIYDNDKKFGRIKSYDFPRPGRLMPSILNNVLEHQAKGPVDIRIAIGDFTDIETAQKLVDIAKNKKNNVMALVRTFNRKEEMKKGKKGKTWVSNYLKVETLLSNSNVKVKYLKASPIGFGKERKIHSKYMLVDAYYPNGSEVKRKKLVFAGSLNYTNTAQLKNSETLLRMEDNGVYIALMDNWNRLRYNSSIDKIDAALMHPNKVSYFFGESNYIKWEPGKGVKTIKTNTSRRKIAKDGWKSLPVEFQKNIDAAFTHPTNGKIYFFKGNKYCVWNLAKKKITKVGKIGVDGWSNLPKYFCKDLSAALAHPTNGKIYFFKENKYCVWQSRKGIISKINTIGIDGWRGLPVDFSADIDAALAHSPSKNIYFFKENKYCVWVPGEGIINPKIRTVGEFGWKGLMFD